MTLTLFVGHVPGNTRMCAYDVTDVDTHQNTVQRLNNADFTALSKFDLFIDHDLEVKVTHTCGHYASPYKCYPTHQTRSRYLYK